MNLNKTKVPRALLLVSFWILLLSIVVIYGSVQKSVIAASANQEIVDKAKSFAWSENDGAKSGSPTSAFSNAAESANLNPDNDCLRFVQTVILSSGVDPDFPKGEYLHNGGVDEYFTVNYMKNSSKWKEISTTNATSLQPGDILVSAVNGIGNNHIFIYLGDNKVASANQGEWYARIGNLSEEWDPNSSSDKEFYYGDNKYQVFRINTLSDSGVSSNQTTSSGLSQQKGLSETLLNKFAQNNILFYNPSDCIDNNPSGLCGNTAKEIYWSALSKYTNDPIKIAGIVGNLANEGGMNPVAWEGGPNSCESAGINGSGELINGWDWYYNGSSTCTGVGAFGLTSGLNKYLHYVNDNAPDLIKYFKNYNEYSYNFMWHPGCGVDSSHPSYGDCLLEKIGADEFGKLVEFEVEYALGDNFKPTTTQAYMDKSFSSPSDAAYWWAQNWEIGEDYLNPKQSRLTDAEKAYDDLKDLDCSFAGESCSKLGELRTKMWTEASQADREDFMYVVEREDYSIAGVEGFMNQIISHHGTNGQLADWLDNQCYAFGGGMSCRGGHTITNEDQDMINEALAGSNHIKFAMGNATGGSSVGAGKIVCVWDGKKCREDVDYSAEGGTGPCSLYSPSEDFGECWGLEGDDEWAEKMKKECGSISSTTASSPNSNGENHTSSPGPVSGSEITWIGDSDSALATDGNGDGLVVKTFPGVDYGPSFNDSTSYIQSCKGISSSCTNNNPSGLDILKKLVKEGKLRKYLVFALGGNDGWTQDTMNDFINLIGNDTKAILTTTKYRGADYTENNKIVKKAAKEHSNIYVADVAANYKDEYMDSSGIEFTNEGAKMFIQTIKEALSAAASNSNTPYRSGVEWNNGWIVSGTMEGLVIEDVTNGQVQLSESKINPIGSYTTAGGKPNKILLHDTEGTIGGLAAYPSDNMYPAHFTIDLKNKTISQHFSIYQPSMAVGTYDKEGPIQFEIVGFNDIGDGKHAAEDYIQNYSDEDWEYLAKVMIAIHEETGIPLTSSVDWAHGNNELSPEEFKNYEGVLGHMHTPGNEKIDPGDIWKFVSAAIERLMGSGGCTTYEGKYPEYLQWDEPWGSVPYSTDNIAGSGCGAASMAMLATVATGQDIFPQDIAALLGDQYYDQVSVHTLDPIVGEHYGFEVKLDTSSSVEETKTKFRQYLNDGYMIHFTGAGCYPGFQSGGTCSNGHVIGIFSIDSNDMVMQANSAWGGNQESSLDDIANAKTWDEFTAIKGGNTSRNTCDNTCGNTDVNGATGSISSLTEAQAQKIADYYNSSQVTASNFIGGFIPSDYAKVNCVSFSYWFVSAFTDAAEISPIPSLVGDGSYIADTGLPSIGWETGNDPTPFSIFGGAGSSAWSHTGVVVGTTNDGEILTIEAAYGMYDARVMTKSPSYFSEGVGILAYPGSHLTPNKGHLGNKSLNEIIGN